MLASGTQDYMMMATQAYGITESDDDGTDMEDESLVIAPLRGHNDGVFVAESQEPLSQGKEFTILENINETCRKENTSISAEHVRLEGASCNAEEEETGNDTSACLQESFNRTSFIRTVQVEETILEGDDASEEMYAQDTLPGSKEDKESAWDTLPVDDSMSMEQEKNESWLHHVSIYLRFSGTLALKAAARRVLEMIDGGPQRLTC